MTTVSSSTSNVLPQSVLNSMNPQSTSSTTSASTSSTADIQNQFLTLLVTQMQNQDPLNPMDNSQVTSQLAQLSTVSGISQLNTTLGSLMQTSSSLQAANLIGQGILAPGSGISLSSSQSLLGVQLPQAVDDAQVVISDSSGNQIQTIDLGAQPAGTVPVAWNGLKADGTTAADGNYTFTVQATAAGQSATATPLQYGTVETVSAGTGTLTVTATGLGTINYSSIAQII